MKFPYLLLYILFFALIFTGCKKKSGNVFLPNEGTQGFDGNGYTDSFTLLTSTIREDSLKTDSLSNDLLGIVNDPIFGQSKASAFFQFQLPQLSNVLTGTLDSVVIIMQYTSTSAYYGDLSSTVDLNVYEVNEDMNRTRTHSNSSYGYNPTSIGSFSGKFKVSDSTTIRESGKRVKISPSLKITLPKTNALAIKLFNATAGNLSSQASFLAFFKGIAVVPSFSSGSGAIAAFNMHPTENRTTVSKIRIYYNDSLQSDFKVLADSRRLSRFEIIGQGSQITKQKSASKKANFDTTYIQAMTGAKMRVQIPYLFNIAKTRNVSIAKAELIIRPVPGTYTSPFNLPARLLLLQPGSTGVNTGILDLLEPFYGGSYNAVLNEYKFNITRHIQSLFTDYRMRGENNNNGLYVIIPTDYPVAPSRIQVDTRKKMPGAGIQFRLYYAEL